MKKIELNIKNLEQEGYTLRVEDGITYIEKEEKKNHSKYGECFSFFQQKIELDKKGKEIVTQTDRLYKKMEDKEQNLESKELMFEGEDLTRELKIDEKVEDCTYYDANKNIIKTIKKDITNNMQYTNEYKQVNGKSVLIKTMNGKINEEPIFIAEYDSKGEKTYLSYIEGDIKKSISYHENGKSISIKKINEEPTFIAEYNLKGIEIYLSYIEGDVKKSIYRDENGILIKEKEENIKTGIIKYFDYDISGSINYISEENKESGIKTTSYYNKFGSVSSSEEETKTGDSKTIYYNYNDNGNLDYKTITTKDKNGKIIDERYSETTDEITTEYIDNKLYPKVIGESKYITLRTIEDLGNGNKKITEGNTITYQYQNETIINTYRSLEEDKPDIISQKIIEREKEKILVEFNIEGDWTSIVRTIKNSPVQIEEFYKKGDSLPTFKVEGFEIPLDNLDKYKDICKKYNISYLQEVLEANEPKKTIQSTVKSFIDFFKR